MRKFKVYLKNKSVVIIESMNYTTDKDSLHYKM